MSHYFTNDKVRSDVRKHLVNINDIPFEFYTDNGIFSKKGLDFGTRTLLSSLENIKGDVLDFGCGYGAIGIYIKKVFECNVDMIDVNLNALKLASYNASLNNVDVNIFKSDIYTNVSKKYDYIISNPPIRVGKEILYKILFEAYDHLKDKGELWIVINKNQGALSTIKALSEKYDVKVVCKNKGFFVIVSKK